MSKLVLERIQMNNSNEEVYGGEVKPITMRMPMHFVYMLDGMAKLAGLTRTDLMREFLESSFDKVCSSLVDSDIEKLKELIFKEWDSDDPLLSEQQHMKDIEKQEQLNNVNSFYTPLPCNFNYVDEGTGFRYQLISTWLGKGWN